MQSMQGSHEKLVHYETCEELELRTRTALNSLPKCSSYPSNYDLHGMIYYHRRFEYIVCMCV